MVSSTNAENEPLLPSSHPPLHSRLARTLSQFSANRTPHVEQHFEAADVVRDVIIGMSDGLTVPFALTAGLSALQSSRLVVAAGLAEIIAGSISMALGGWLAGRSEINHFDAEKQREFAEVRECPEEEVQEIVDIFSPYGLDKESLQPLIEKLTQDEEKFVDFMMRFELNLSRPSPNRSIISALTIGFSYLFGGMIPLIPYFFIEKTHEALPISCLVAIICLFVFGFVKGRILGTQSPFLGAIETAVIGALAAAAAFGIAKLVPQD
ncbi:Ccc1 family [Paraphysoderma sedebokerense]|nr:Ccc1 family [Paraphysoderma sedebokerense]